MKKFECGWVAIAALILVSESSMAADIVQRRSATTRLQGEIIETSATSITLKPKSGETIEIPAYDIALIDWDGEPANFRLARTDEQAGRLQKALDGYTKLLSDPKASREGLKTDIEFFLARTTAKLAPEDPAKFDDAVKKLDTFRKKHAKSFRIPECIELLGQLYLSKNDYPKARDTYESMGQISGSESKLASKLALARIDLMEGKTDEARKGFEAVSEASTKNPAELQRKLEAKVGVATCLQLQKEYDKAGTLLESVISEAAADDSRTQAEAYLRLGDGLQAAGKTKEALLAYLHVDVLYSSEKDYEAEALYHLSKLWGGIGQPERGADAAERLTSDYPESPWAKKLKSPSAP